MLSQGTRLHDAGSRLEFAYFPRSCVVSEAIVMDDGRSAGTAIVGREGVVGLPAVYLADAQPVVASTRAENLISGAAFKVSTMRLAVLLQSANDFTASVANYQRSLLHQANQIAACNALHSLHQRVCRVLLSVDHRGGGQPIPVTQETLAQILGAHRASLNKVIQKLEASGAIAPVRRGHIDIADRSILTTLSCACVLCV